MRGISRRDQYFYFSIFGRDKFRGVLDEKEFQDVLDVKNKLRILNSVAKVVGKIFFC